MTQKQTRTRPRRERRPEDRHARAYVNELLDIETKRKLERLRDELAREEAKK